jgi:uncharacterized protein YcbX
MVESRAGLKGARMRIEHLYRYPVKGLTAEAIEATELAPAGTFPWDRAFALAQGDAPFDPAHPAWIPKRHFLCLMANPRAARLRASFDPRHAVLALSGPGGQVAENPFEAAGQARLGAYLTAFLGAEARGTPRFLHLPGHVFADDARPVVSLLNLASLADLAARAGAPRHRLRFRANICLAGIPPWAEFGWPGREIALGGTRLRVLNPIQRCPAIAVNPDTAQTDTDGPQELRRLYGHPHFGIFAEVLEGGRLAVGDALELLP